jgi:hypothetical protein
MTYEEIQPPFPDPELSAVPNLLVVESANNTVSAQEPLVESGVAAPEPIEASDAQQPNWVRKNLNKISCGIFLGGLAVGFAVNPFHSIEKKFDHREILALGIGIGTTEASFIAGLGIMGGVAGMKLGKNPLKWAGRKDEVFDYNANSTVYKAGLALNTLGALGTPAVIAAGVVTSLPVEAWAGPALWIGIDVLGTVGARASNYARIREANKARTGCAETGNVEIASRNQTFSNNTSEAIEPSRVRADTALVEPTPIVAEKASKPPEATVRKAKLKDMERLAELDLSLFKKSYGAEKPTKESLIEMFTKRYTNNPKWMFVTEVDGQVEGFVTGFRTNKSKDDFISWEDCTANGTLDGCVDQKGKYAYIVNMTIAPGAVNAGAEDKILATLFAKTIESGVEYAYFSSRMPIFRSWLKYKQGINPESDIPEDELFELATKYVNTRKENGDRLDYELQGYENYGYTLGRIVPNGFQDNASMNFGVITTASIPPNNFLKRAMPIRKLIGGSLRYVANHHPTLLAKVMK